MQASGANDFESTGERQIHKRTQRVLNDESCCCNSVGCAGGIMHIVILMIKVTDLSKAGES